MCLKIQPPWGMPAETKRIGQILLKEHDVYRMIGDQLFEQLNEKEYADLYSAEGKPVEPGRQHVPPGLRRYCRLT